MISKQFRIIPIILFAAAMAPSTSFSATDVTQCSTLSTPGETYNLVNNLVGTSPSVRPFADTACVNIAASGITLECNTFTISNNGTFGTTVGIFLGSGLTNVAVKNCRISGYTDGVAFLGSNSTVTSSDASGNLWGFNLDGINNVATGNRAYANTVIGFLIYGTYTVTDNEAYNNWVAFSIAGDNNLLTRNAVYDNDSTGISLFGSNNVVEANGVLNNADGIHLHPESTYNILKDNSANNNKSGIVIEALADNNTLTNNSVLNGEIGAVIDSKNNTVNDNVFCDSASLDISQGLSDAGNVGDNNECTLTSGWNDEGTTGCTFLCGCRLDPNPEHLDTDGDGLGDVCDPLPFEDVDGLCPCDGWRNHGEYLRCVAGATGSLLAEGKITGAQNGTISNDSARNRCGQNK